MTTEFLLPPTCLFSTESSPCLAVEYWSGPHPAVNGKYRYYSYYCGNCVSKALWVVANCNHTITDHPRNSKTTLSQRLLHPIENNNYPRG